MGFRGEALASMTYVGHVTVTTITRGQLHGYRFLGLTSSTKPSHSSSSLYKTPALLLILWFCRVSYRDGVMENEPKACAAVKGTQIVVSTTFFLSLINLVSL